MTQESWGVWADPDCLLVRTPGFALLIERQAGRLSVALSRVEPAGACGPGSRAAGAGGKERPASPSGGFPASDAGETVIFETRALALFDLAGNRMVLKARDPETGPDLVFDNDLDRELELGRTELDVAVTDGGLVLGREGRPVERLDRDRLVITLPMGRTAQLARLEAIEPALPRPGQPADEGNIGRCLQEWALGTGLYLSPDGLFRSLTIGTNRFSFGFSYGAVDGDDLLHCRAARVRVTDAGVVFAPVLRMLARGDRLAVAAAPDFAAAAAEDLAADRAEPGPDQDLSPEYWRLVGASPDGLELESSAGARYRLARPMPDNPALLEWFRYRDYAQGPVAPEAVPQARENDRSSQPSGGFPAH